MIALSANALNLLDLRPLRAIKGFLFYVAPVLIGGDAPGVLGSGVKTLADAWSLDIASVRRVGRDLCIEARPG